MAMLRGRAKGGPRDGVKLECPESWHGRIMKDQHSMYPGHYEIEIDRTGEEIKITWVWIPDPPQETKAPARSRQPFAGYQYH